MHSKRRSFRTLAIAATLLAAAAASHRAARAGDAPRAIDAIENDLVADDPAVRAKAATELTDQFPDGAVAVSMLVDLLDDEDKAVVAAAAKALDDLSLRGMLKIARLCLDARVVNAKSRIVQTLPTLLRTGQPSAIDAFDLDELCTGQTPQDVPMMAALLPNRARSVSAIPLLLTLARGADGDTQTAARAALGVLGADALASTGISAPKSSLRVDATMMTYSFLDLPADVGVWMGARLIPRVRSSDLAVVLALTKAFGEQKRPVVLNGRSLLAARPEICRALGGFGTRAAGVAPALLKHAAKTDEIPDVETCVHVLLQMGKEDDVVALLSRNPPTADRVMLALAAEGRAAPVLVPYLLKALSEDDPFAASALAKFGHAANDALPALRERCAATKEIGRRLKLADAILAISPGDAEALAVLESAAPDPDAGEEAIAILAARAPPSDSLAQRLRKVVAADAGGQPGVRCGTNIVDALVGCGRAAAPAVPDLLRMLERENARAGDPKTRSVAVDRQRRLVRALSRIGPDAAAAVPALTALRDKGDETIRVPAAQALRRIKAKK